MMNTTNNVIKSGKESFTESSAYKIWMVVFGVLTVVGLVAWFIQLTKGLVLSDLGDNKVWGLYIVGFMFFTGVAAGSLIMASFPHVANLTQYKPYTKIASFVAAVSSVIAAGLFILVDIGNPLRLWNMIIHANFQSPLIWDAIILIGYAFLSIYFLSRLIQLDTDSAQENSVKKWAWVSLIAGLLVGITANVFALQISKPSWYSGLQPFSFTVAAIIAGIALLILLGILLKSKQYISMENDLLDKMGKVVAAFLVFDLAIVATDLVTTAYPGTPEGLTYIQYIFTGGGAPLFWIQVGSALLAIIILLSSSMNVRRIGIGSLLALVAIFMQKFSMLMAGFALPLITYAGPLMHGGNGYFPSLVEFGVAIGIISLGALLLMIGFKRLPLQSRKMSI